MSEVIVIDSGKETEKKRRTWVWILVGIILVIALSIGGFLFWALNPTVQIDEIALNALESGDDITVTDRAWLAFLPHEPPSTGFIFYPGGRVPAEAYAPVARQIAEQGYLVVIVYPPLNLAILKSDMALPVMEHFSAIEHWVVGGHSLGGSTAAIFAGNHLDVVDGIVFMASYPTRNTLLDSDLAITSIYGTNDGLARVEDIDESREKLPADTRFVAIEGGNHAQFGYYGTQSGDNPATITQEEQIRQVVAATLELLTRVDNR